MSDYYIPLDNTDICLGLECLIKSEYSGEWVNQKLDLTSISLIHKYIFCDEIRVPYLTREQVINEGWALVHENHYSEFDFYFQKKYKLKDEPDNVINYTCSYHIYDHTLTMYMFDGDSQEDGTLIINSIKCRCINDFRKIWCMVNHAVKYWEEIK